MARSVEGLARRKAAAEAARQTPEAKEKARTYYAEYRNRPGMREKLLERGRKFRAADRKRNKGYTLKYQYGIEQKDWDRMFKAQKGCCAICGIHQSEMKKALCVDHDHVTKEVRGLLCFHCNTGLGHLRADDGIEILEKAIDYLRKVG